MQLKIENDSGHFLWIGPEDLVQVPKDRNERARNRTALMDALFVSDQTIVTHSSFATANAQGSSEIQNSQRLGDFLGI